MIHQNWMSIKEDGESVPLASLKLTFLRENDTTEAMSSVSSWQDYLFNIWLITLNIVSLVKYNLVQLWEQPIQSDQIRQNLAQFEKFLRILRVCLVVGQNFEYSLPNAFCCWTNFHCCKWPSIEKNNHLVTLQQPYIEFSVVKCTNVKVHLHYD